MIEKCKCCGSKDLERKEVTHSNGTKHIKVTCNECYKCSGYDRGLGNDEFKMPEGTKYAGKTVLEVVRDDRRYAEWASENFRSNNIKKRFQEALRAA